MRVKFLLKIFPLLVVGLFTTQALADHVPFLVPMKTVYPGQIISDTALGEKNFYIKKQAIPLYVTDIAQVLNKVAKRTLVAGKPIAVTAIAEPILVERGQSVKLVFRSSSLMITGVGISLQAGSEGDVIKLRNVDSGVTISGMVLADGSVEVGI